MVNLHEFHPYVSKFIGKDYEKIDSLKLYIGAFFQSREIENSQYTKYLLNLDIEEVKPFEEILEKLGYKASQNTNTSDISGGFVDVMAGVASLQLVKDITLELEKLGNSDLSELLKEVDAIKGLNNNKPKSWIDGLLSIYLSPKEIDNLNVILASNDGSNASESEIFNILKSVLEHIKFKKTESNYTEEVRQAVDNLLQRMEVLYDRLWNNSYIGIILPDGTIKYNKGTKYRGKEALLQSLSVYIQSLARAWYKEVDITDEKVAPEGVFLNLEYDLVPDLHIGYLTNRQEWLKNYKPTLKGKLLRQLSSVSKETYSDFVTQLYKTLTSCLFLVDVNNHTMQLRASYIKQQDELKEEMLEILKSNATNAQSCNILTTKISKGAIVSDILSLTCIYNMTAFEKEILFAHKLYTGTNPVDTKLTETVLGVKLDGSYAKTNLYEYRFISIIAGSRSGKGTLTMSLLASLLASGEGVIYLDNKPDIASLFWNMERSMKAKGKDVKFLAIDSSGQRSEFDKAVGERIIKDSDGNVVNIKNVPKGMNSQVLLPLRTYKALQLAMLLGRIRPKDVEMDKGNTFIFIDEATLLTQAIEKLYLALDAGLKAKKSNEQLANYCDKVITFISEVHQAFSDISLKQGEENLTFVTIGQSLDGVAPKDWRCTTAPTLPKIDAPKKNLFFSILGSTQFWLSGREQVNSKCYELTPEENTMADKTGSFIAHIGKPSSNKFSGTAGIYAYGGNQSGPAINTSNSTLFRSYFALVNNDYKKDLVESKVAEGFDSLSKLLSENKNNGFTFNFLNNVLNNDINNLTDGSFRNAMTELYNNDLVKGVGFEGLIESIVALKGLSEDSYIEGLNRGYNRFNRIFEKTQMKERFGYSCLEEYLYDCSPDSLFTNEEILNMYFGTYTPKAKVSGTIDIGISAEKEETSLESNDTKQPVNTTNNNDKTAESKQNTQTSQGTESATTFGDNDTYSEDNVSSAGDIRNKSRENVNTPIKNTNVKSVSESTKDTNVLSPFINTQKAPFQTTRQGIVTNLIDLNTMSNEILKSISKTYGGLEAVEVFRVNANGVFSINDAAFTPRFPESFYNGLPLALQQKVMNGSLVELFNFSNVYKFKNLQSFEIENAHLGHGRCRIELGIPRKKRYSWLFKKFGNLQYINVAGIEYSMNTPDTVDAESYSEKSAGLGSKLAGIFGLGRTVKGAKTSTPNPLSDSFTSDLWNSRPVRVLTGAFGWTMGIKAITLAATIFGPWGLLFGALAAAGAYKELKDEGSANKNNVRQSYSNPDYRGNGGNSNRGNQNRQQNKSNNSSNKGKNDKHNDYYN